MSFLDALRSPEARVPRRVEGTEGIVDLPDPEVVALPLEYPGQILFEPLVEAGDEVARNQPVGRSDRDNYVHAPVSGRVCEIGTIWSARSYHVPAVVIEAGDGPTLSPGEVMAQCQTGGGATRVSDRFRATGVISPWTTPGQDHGESDVSEYPEIEHLLITGCDEEPNVFAHERVMQAHAEDLREGIHRIRDLAPAATTRLTVRRTLLEWARATFGDAAEVIGVPDSYRHRVERLLVPRVTGVPVPHAAAFRSHGVAVMSTEDVLAALAGLRGEPYVRKVITVSGGMLDRPVTVRAALGTTVRDVLRRLGIDSEDYGRVIMGGPMRGRALFTDETPVSKFQHGIHLLRRDELPSEVNLTCINCGRCTRACSSNLQVHMIGRCVEYDQFKDALEHHPEACVECGLCTFVCPSHRPLVQMVRIAKGYRSSQS